MGLPAFLFSAMLPRIIVEGYGDMTEEIAVELALIEKAQRDRDIAACAARQAQIARTTPEAGTKDYALTAQIDNSVYAAWEAQLGPGCWKKGSGFREWFLKKFPQCRVKYRPGHTTVRIPRTFHEEPKAGTILDQHGRAAA